MRIKFTYYGKIIYAAVDRVEIINVSKETGECLVNIYVKGYSIEVKNVFYNALSGRFLTYLYERGYADLDFANNYTAILTCSEYYRR